jgi:hypothetical protein
MTFRCLTDREQAVALELDPDLAQGLKRRFDAFPNATIIQGSVNDPEIVGRVRELEIDSAILFNVLEHIQDDSLALRSIASMLDCGGSLAILVPAFPSIFGAMDRGVGHVRRYRRKELVTKMEAGGFFVSRAHYVNLPGYLAWFVNGRILRASSPVGGPRLVSIYDRTMIPATRLVERAVHPPCGQSLFVVGTRI